MKNLTVIYPNVSNRTVIKDIKKQLNENDELILVKTSSKNIVFDINHRIEQSKNDDILIINPRDTTFTKKNEVINTFRREGQCCSWVSESNKITAKSSFKFNKNNVDTPEESNSGIKNIKQYISFLYNSVSQNNISFINELNNPSNYVFNECVTVAMINYMREERLIKTLEYLLESSECKLDLVLQCQGLENIDVDTKLRIEDVCKKFNSYELNFTYGNIGTAIPRFNTTTRAFNKNSNYILILDSDMDIPKWTIERLVGEHKKRSKYGVISCWCTPSYAKWEIKNDKLISSNVTKGFHETAILGTGCAMVKRDVLKNCWFNTDLTIGFVDFHWCAEVRNNGWLLGILAEENHKLNNDKSYNTEVYKKERFPWDEIERSRKIFFEKWGLTITGSRWPRNKNFSSVNFIGTNLNGSRGPRIQMSYRKHYFNHINNPCIFFNSKKPKNWTHYTYLIWAKRHKRNKLFSVGPNIDIRDTIPDFIFNKPIVADSFWFKNYLEVNYDIVSDVWNIPVYVGEEFYYKEPNNKNDTIIGVVGYYEKNDIKNLLSLTRICNHFNNIKFQLFSSRDRKMFPNEIRGIENLDIINVKHEDIPEQMSKWSAYLGLSRRERGPATLQECKCIGIPTICPNHTGFREFNPTIKMNLEPFIKHSEQDKDYIIENINMFLDDKTYYMNKAEEEKHEFWKEEKHPSIITNKWEQFFNMCLERYT